MASRCPRAPGPTDAIGDAEQRLDVMSHLVGDDVGLGEITGSAEAVAQLAEERKVQVYLVIGGTVKGTDRGLGETACRLDGP